MKHRHAVGVLGAAILVALCGPSWADALQEVLAAHNSGQDASELASLTPLANGGDAAAEFKLGVMNARAWVGASRPDYAAAAAWYQKSADQGFAPAQTALGALYLNGRGVTLDRKMARYWWTKAAAQGNKIAQSNLATLDAMEHSLGPHRPATSQVPPSP